MSDLAVLQTILPPGADPVLRAEWHAVARSSDIARSQILAVRILGEDLVLWRAEDDALHAWQDLCIHRGARLSLGWVESGCLVCPYHGWKYAATGQCVAIPAQPDRTPPLKARAITFSAKERHGLIWVCLGQPAHLLPDFPVAEDAAYRSYACGPYRFTARGPRLIENFLDVSHLPIVHAGLLGEPGRAAIADYEMEPVREGEGPASGDIRVFQPDPDGTGRAAEVVYRYRVHAPLVASFVKSQGDQRLHMLYAVTPVEAGVSMAWAVFVMNYALDVPEADLQAFQKEVILQDKAIVESQRPELLPLDLQAELHLRSDRLAMAYRVWLRATGMRYGVA
jgi:phenylpropionate dioxygenase-like ring-hydroxylating dioxygenase large terminal subunit